MLHHTLILLCIVLQLSKNKNSIVGPYSNSFGRANLGRPHVTPVSNVGVGVVGAYRPRARTPQTQARGLSISGAPVSRPGLAVRPTALNFAVSSLYIAVFFLIKMNCCLLGLAKTLGRLDRFD